MAAQQMCSCVIIDTASAVDFSPAYTSATPGVVNKVVQINFKVTAGYVPVVGYMLCQWTAKIATSFQSTLRNNPTGVA